MYACADVRTANLRNLADHYGINEKDGSGHQHYPGYVYMGQFFCHHPVYGYRISPHLFGFSPLQRGFFIIARSAFFPEKKSREYDKASLGFRFCNGTVRR